MNRCPAKYSTVFPGGDVHSESRRRVFTRLRFFVIQGVAATGSRVNFRLS